MTSTFKVWIHIEEINEDSDVYADVGEPWGVGEFDTLEEAEELREHLTRNSDATAFRCSNCNAAFYKDEALLNVKHMTTHCPDCGSSEVNVMPAKALR
jgi:DNA-directed RNA polymerase subunit RPC12/RpoP